MKLFAQLFGVWIGAMWCVMLSTYAAGVFSGEELEGYAVHLGIISLFWLCLYGITCSAARFRSRASRQRRKN